MPPSRMCWQGLGAHAHAALGVPVIGVAKSAFRTATHAIPVVRGTSARPLFVTAAGMSRNDAADLVRHMAGRFTLPDALRRADVLARAGGPAVSRLQLVLHETAPSPPSHGPPEPHLCPTTLLLSWLKVLRRRP